jgi:hypothetical protein
MTYCEGARGAVPPLFVGSKLCRGMFRMTLKEVKRLYHFTDERNLDSIRELGGLYSWRKLSEIGHKVDAPGGNDWSHDADAFKGLDAYVHLCFRRNQPMEYRARTEGRIVKSIFLEIDPAVLEIEGVLFTDDVSNKRGVEPHAVDEADDLIDFQILRPGIDLGNPDIRARLQKAEKYEILVPDFISIDLIRNL